MTIEMHYMITQEGGIVEWERVDRSMHELHALFAAFIPSMQACINEYRRIIESLAEAMRPIAAAFMEFTRSWWRALSPWMRAWVRRRMYADRPVTGSRRSALMVARWSVHRL